MIYFLMAALVATVVAAAAAIYFLGWIGVSIVGVAIFSLPWTGGFIGSFFVKFFVRQVLGDMAKPLEAAAVTLDSLEPAGAPASALDDDYADDMEQEFGPRDWFHLELTIAPNAKIVDEDGDPPQWDPEMIIPFIPSDNDTDELDDPNLTICEVVRWELFDGGKWQTNRQGFGTTRVRMHVGIPQTANRLRFLFCMQTVFGEIALPQRPALLHA